MRTRAVALAFLACLLSSVGGRRVKANAVNDASAGTTHQIHSLVGMEQSLTGQVNDAAVGTSDQTASLAESEQMVAKKPIHSAALLLLALDPAAASFSSPTLLGRFGSLVKEHKDGLRNAALMPTMQYDGGYGGRFGGYGTRGGMYGSTYDDEMRGDMVPWRPALGFGGSTEDMIDDNIVQRGDDYGYGGSSRMYGRSRRGYGNMYGRRGYGSMYGGGYGYGGSGRYGRYDDYGYGYGNSGYGNMYGQRGYGSMYGDRYGLYDNDRYGMRGYGYGGSGRYGRYDDSGYGGYGSNYGRSRGGYGAMYDDMYRRGYGNMYDRPLGFGGSDQD